MSVIKTMVALGFAGAVMAASATPTLARDQFRGPFAAATAPLGYHAYARDPFMGEPRGQRLGRGWGSLAPRATSRPGESWDPYGMRWDGGGQ
jgi:hypothetical protein